MSAWEPWSVGSNLGASRIDCHTCCSGASDRLKPGARNRVVDMYAGTISNEWVSTK